MLCQTCQRRFDCIPAALAANDTHMYSLLERLKQCERYSKEEQVVATLKNPRQRNHFPVQRPA